MANLRLTRLILFDKWPGNPNINAGRPTATINGKAGWDNTVDNFSSADDTAKACNPPVPIGEKRTAYTDNTNCPGWYTMMYLCLHSFEDGMDISRDFCDGHIFHSPLLTTNSCTSTSEWADTSRGPYFVCARCTTGSDFTKGGGPVAVFCSTYTYSDGTKVKDPQGYGDGYGWAWVGGVCPCKDLTIMDDTLGDYKGVDLTVGMVHKGLVFLENTGGCALIESADETCVWDLTTGITVSCDPAGMAIGWACESAA